MSNHQAALRTRPVRVTKNVKKEYTLSKPLFKIKSRKYTKKKTNKETSETDYSSEEIEYMCYSSSCTDSDNESESLSTSCSDSCSDSCSNSCSDSESDCIDNDSIESQNIKPNNNNNNIDNEHSVVSIPARKRIRLCKYQEMYDKNSLTQINKSKININELNSTINNRSINNNNKHNKGCKLYFWNNCAKIHTLHNNSSNNNKNENDIILFGKKECNLLVNGFCHENNFFIKDLIPIISKYFNGCKLEFNANRKHVIESIFINLNENDINKKKGLINISVKLKESKCIDEGWGNGFVDLRLSLIGFKKNLVDKRDNRKKYLTKDDFFDALKTYKNVKYDENDLFEKSLGSRVLNRAYFRKIGFGGEKGSQSCFYQTFSVRRKNPTFFWYGEKNMSTKAASELVYPNANDYHYCFTNLKWGDTMNTTIDFKKNKIGCDSDCSPFKYMNAFRRSFETNLYENGKDEMEYIFVVEMQGCDCNVENGRCFEITIDY